MNCGTATLKPQPVTREQFLIANQEQRNCKPRNTNCRFPPLRFPGAAHYEPQAAMLRTANRELRTVKCEPRAAQRANRESPTPAVNLFPMVYVEGHTNVIDIHCVHYLCTKPLLPRCAQAPSGMTRRVASFLSLAHRGRADASWVLAHVRLHLLI